MIITAIFCTMILLYYGDSFIMPVKNIQLSLLHGVFGSVGIILYVLGAKYLPFIGINETPERNTLIGGVFILGALILQGLKARKPHATATP
jgi:hypothetical protein